jgi:hypothetical protein
MTNLRERLAAALAGMPYPARTWQIIAWADYNAVSADAEGWP